MDAATRSHDLDSRQAAGVEALRERFPSETDFRFVALVVAVLGSSLFMFNLLSPTVSSGDLADRTLECLPILDRAQTAAPEQIPAIQAAFNSCMSETKFAIADWMLGGLALVAVVAFVLYLLQPLWVRFRMRQERLGPDLAAVSDHIRQLSLRAGLRRPPEVRWDPLNGSLRALAFGRAGSYSLSLSGGLVMTTFNRDRDLFSGVVNHELAHLKHRDVDKTYFSIGLWWAFLLVAVAPFALTLGGLSSRWTLDMIWRVLALFVLTFVLLISVLRAREIDADLRAATWSDPELLRRALRQFSHRMSRLSLGILATHPPVEERERALRGDVPRFGATDALLLGVAATIGLAPIRLLFFHLTDAGTSQFLTAVVLTPIVAGVIGSACWRDAAMASLHDSEPPQVGRVALGLVAGAAAGLVLSLPAAASTTPAPNLTMASAMFYAAWAAAFAMGAAVLLKWLAVVAGLRATQGHAIADRYAIGALIVFTAAFGLLFGALLSLRQPGALGAITPMSPADLYVWAKSLTLFLGSQQTPVLTLVLAGLCLYPALSIETPWHVRGVRVLLAVIVFVVLLTSVWLLWKFAVPQAQKTFLLREAFYFARVWGVAAVQLATCIWIVARAGARALPEALLATFVAGAICAAVVVVETVALGGIPADVIDWWGIFIDATHLGTILTAIVLLVFGGLMEGAPWRRHLLARGSAASTARAS